MRIKNEQFITIQGWMRNNLNLKGNELLIYALIYGFSQDGESCLSGGLSYIADWTGSVKSTVQNSIQSLIDKDLIIKKSESKNNITFCEYRANLKSVCPTENRYAPLPKIGTPPLPKIGTNNIYIYNTYYDNEINKMKDVDPTSTYPNFVKWLFITNPNKKPLTKVLSLSDQISYESFKELMSEYEGEVIRETILSIENYTKKSYKSFNLTLRAWLRNQK